MRITGVVGVHWAIRREQDGGQEMRRQSALYSQHDMSLVALESNNAIHFARSSSHSKVGRNIVAETSSSKCLSFHPSRGRRFPSCTCHLVFPYASLSIHGRVYS